MNESGIRSRAVISDVSPAVDAGRFPVKRIAGDIVHVEALIFCDGHDRLRAEVIHRRADADTWQRSELQPTGVEDRWAGTFRVGDPGREVYAVVAWIDHLLTWRTQLVARHAAGQDLSLELRIGAGLLDDAAGRADSAAAAAAAGGAPDANAAADRDVLRRAAAEVADPTLAEDVRAGIATDDEVVAAADRWPDRSLATVSDVQYRVTVDRPRAQFSAWYEFFPRSCGPEPGVHGTFADATARLGELAELGFDVIYLPPIHPVGSTNRKGRNNALVADDRDVGSPWAIGAAAGGHTAVHPDLGSIDDLRTMIATARDLGMELALDIAFQCAPDHPWLTEHPDWFRHLPDGSIRYAENPPKKYEDIVPIDFETADASNLWLALYGVFVHWIEAGVRIFRVDNPHTKSFRFWEWCIDEITQRYPDVLFLAEAFTRPALMHHLAKSGFTQSYTYFAWRNARWELREYFEELSHGPGAEYFRPNVWPNTPDILTAELVEGGPAAFAMRAVLAATASASYGIYGPPFERAEAIPREPGSEEYLDSEKYQLRHWPSEPAPAADLRPLLGRLNAIRRAHPALQTNRTLAFHDCDDEAIFAYSKSAPANPVPGAPADGDVILCVLNLDPHHVHEAELRLWPPSLGVDWNETYDVVDLLTDECWTWHGDRAWVRLDPAERPGHVFHIRKRSAR